LITGIRDIRNSLVKHGCHLETSGSLFTVSNLPSWKALIIVQENIDDLAKLYMVEELFSTPYREHTKPDLDEREGCTVCKLTWQIHCPFHGKKELTPRNYMKSGCDLYKKNNDILF